MMMADTFKKEWLEEAITTLGHYLTEPFINDFLKRYDLYERNKTKKQKLSVIKSRIAASNDLPCFKDIADYIDELKLYGKQNVFLFQLKGNHQIYLNDLKNIIYIKHQLLNYITNKFSNIDIEQIKSYLIKFLNNELDFSQFNRDQLYAYYCESLFNNNTLVWEAPEPDPPNPITSLEPVLAEVKLFRREQVKFLCFKWVETRSYLLKKNKEAPIPTFDREYERSVNFFIINLNNGTSEIRIQSLQDYSDSDLNELLDFYVEEISKVITFSKFSRIPLEPVIKSIIDKQILVPSRWQFIYPGKKPLEGKGNPKLFFKLGLPFTNYFGRFIGIKWKYKQKKEKTDKIFFSIRGDRDHINFNSITDKSKVDFILSELKKLATENIEMDELKIFENLHPEYSRVLLSIDYYFSRLKKLTIKAEYISSEIWLSKNIIIEIFEALAENFPKSFYYDENKEMLELRVRYNLKKGLRKYVNQKTERNKRKKIIRAAFDATISTTFGLLIINEALSIFKTAIFEKTWDSIFPNIPFIYVQIIIILLIGIIYFGRQFFSIFKKIPQEILTKTFAIVSGSEKQINNSFSKNYEKWKDTTSRQILKYLSENSIADEQEASAS